jgi:hypothetical protein
MERAIRVMAGRHRDKEVFAPFMFMPGATFNLGMGVSRPVYQDGQRKKVADVMAAKGRLGV